MDARARWAIGLGWALLAACGAGVGTGGQRLPPATSLSVDFGAVVERTSERLEVEVQNPLAEPIEVLPLAGEPPFRGALFAATTVAPGGRLAIPVVFAPAASGPAHGILTVKSPFGALATIAVTGLGVDDLGLRCDESLEFGPAPIGGAEERQSFRCENLSAGQTRVRVGATDGDEHEAFRVDLEDADALRALPAGGTLEVPVVFQPRPYGGTSFAWIELFLEDESRRGRVLLYGTTADACFFAVPEALAFACLAPGETATLRLALVNGCAREVEITGLAIDGGSGAFSVPGHGPYRVPAPVDGIPGELAVDVTFAPRAENGPDVRGTLIALLNDRTQPRLDVPLAGCVDPP